MCNDCGKGLSIVKPNYGHADDNGITKRICYDCCAIRDKQQMRDKGKITLYLTQENSHYVIGNWPGTFKVSPFRVKVGRHNMAGKRYDAYFSFEGKPWKGVTYGDNTQICHCRQLKA